MAVHEPNVIRGQFPPGRFLMLKMFLGAMGTPALCVSALALFAPTKFTTARKAWQEGQLERGVLSRTSFGALLLGVGMAVAGACPGMVLAQVGSGVPNSGLTFFGGLCGGLCGAFVYDTFARFDHVVESFIFCKRPQTPRQSLRLQVHPVHWLFHPGRAAGGGDARCNCCSRIVGSPLSF